MIGIVRMIGAAVVFLTISSATRMGATTHVEINALTSMPRAGRTRGQSTACIIDSKV